MPLPTYNRGIAYNDKGELEQAITDYNQAITLDPQNADAYKTCAGLLHYYSNQNRR